MKSFSVLAVFVCVALASRVDASADPLQQAIQSILAGKAGIEALCNPVCFGSCALLEQTCVDVEGLVECAVQIGACKSSCAELCGCLTDCPTGCQEDCGSLDNILAQVFCANRVSTCTGICQSQCGVDLFTKRVMEGINTIIAGLQGLVNQGGAP